MVLSAVLLCINFCLVCACAFYMVFQKFKTPQASRLPTFKFTRTPRSIGVPSQSLNFSSSPQVIFSVLCLLLPTALYTHVQFTHWVVFCAALGFNHTSVRVWFSGRYHFLNYYLMWLLTEIDIKNV